MSSSRSRQAFTLRTSKASRTVKRTSLSCPCLIAFFWRGEQSYVEARQASLRSCALDPSSICDAVVLLATTMCFGTCYVTDMRPLERPEAGSCFDRVHSSQEQAHGKHVFWLVGLLVRMELNGCHCSSKSTMYVPFVCSPKKLNRTCGVTPDAGRHNGRKEENS